MTDKVQKIRKEVERLKEETSIGLSEHENGVEQGRIEIINALSIFLDSLQEEPVSEDLEKAAEEYAYTNWASDDYHEGAAEGLPFDAIGHTEKCFKAGAKWQKSKMMAKGFPVEIDSSRSDGRCILSGNFARFETGDKVKVIVIKEK